jgi:flagellar biosynthesis GTPase FlhF
MSAAAPFLAPGTYKFTVRSTDEAVALIRGKLGPAARVLSVRPAAAATTPIAKTK